jgi:hypothetical protein
MEYAKVVEPVLNGTKANVREARTLVTRPPQPISG